MKQTVVKINGSPVAPQAEPRKRLRAKTVKAPQAEPDLFKQYQSFLEPAFKAVGRCVMLIPLFMGAIATAFWKGFLCGTKYLAEAMEETERKL